MLFEVERPRRAAGAMRPPCRARRTPTAMCRHRRRRTTPRPPATRALRDAAAASWPRSGTTTARAPGARRSCAQIRAAPLHERRLPALDGVLDPAGARRQPLDARGAWPASRAPYAALADADRDACRRGAVRLPHPVRRLPQRRRHGRQHRRAAPQRRAARRSTPTCTRWPPTPNPVGLLGAIYVIEGTGQRIVPALLPLLQAQLKLPPNAVPLPRLPRRTTTRTTSRAGCAAVELVLAADASGARRRRHRGDRAPHRGAVPDAVAGRLHAQRHAA